MKHLADPYEEFLCDEPGKKYEDGAEKAESLADLDCPDCIKVIWNILEEALV